MNMPKHSREYEYKHTHSKHSFAHTFSHKCTLGHIYIQTAAQNYKHTSSWAHWRTLIHPLWNTYWKTLNNSRKYLLTQLYTHLQTNLHYGTVWVITVFRVLVQTIVLYSINYFEWLVESKLQYKFVVHSTLVSNITAFKYFEYKYDTCRLRVST